MRIRHPVRRRSKRADSALGPEHLETVVRISYDARLFVWQRDGGRCQHCWSTTDLQFDHVIPASWGGSSQASNVELLCGACNREKSARLFATRSQS